MKHLFLKSAFAIALVTAGVAHAETMMIPWTNGSLRAPSSCYEGFTGGVTNVVPGTHCWVNMPLPLPAGKTVKQISAMYASLIGPSTLDVDLQRRDMSVSPQASGWQNSFSWSAVSGSATTTYGNLMHQSGAPPFVTYSDAFTIGASDAYRIEVEVGDSSTEFLGIYILYQ